MIQKKMVAKIIKFDRIITEGNTSSITNHQLNVCADEDRGRDRLATPKKQAEKVKLSGKRTFVGRNSGECASSYVATQGETLFK
jgi:hypothetical protein